MSKEVAAAILTRIYFEKVPGVDSVLQGQPSGIAVSSESVDAIGRVYAEFLGRIPLFQQWAVENIGGPDPE